MTNFLDVTKHLNDALEKTSVFEGEQKEMLLSFAEMCRRDILINIQKGGTAEDDKSQVGFVAFMSIVDVYLYQQKEGHSPQDLYFEPVEKSVDYGRKFYERLIGKKHE